MKSFITIWLVFFFGLLSTSAQLRIAPIFGDHMVLQRNKPIPIWGWAAKNALVEVRLNNQPIRVKSDASGKWTVSFPAMKEGGPYALTISTAQQSIQVNDIMLGEVWLCSGQSNMEFNMRDAFHYASALNTVNQSDIRQVIIPNEVSLVPKDSMATCYWLKANSESLGYFTAVGYSFAKELSSQLNVTVGLIKDAWGGSQIEGWIGKQAMLESGEFKSYAQSFPENWEQADALLFKNLQKKLKGKNAAIPSTNLQGLLTNDSTVFQSWLPYAPPSQWDWQGIWAFRGAGFMERTISVSASDIGKSANISLGENDGQFQFYINGKLCQEGKGKNARKFQIPANSFVAGRNILLIHQEPQIEPAWFGNGFIGEPSSLYIQFEAYTQSLSGNGWRMMPDFSMPWHYVHAQNNLGSIIYNAMVHPIIPFAMRGILWYQGESNAERANQYQKSFPLLINSWRKAWNEELPFYFVQLASFGKFPNSNQGSEWAELREAQTMALQLPATGMAVTIDIGNPDNVHPRNKEDVGKRLAANALSKTYQVNLGVCSGPSFQSVTFDPSSAVLSFGDLGKGWLVKDPYGYIKGFEIAGKDQKFYFAQARIDHGKLVVWNDQVKDPQAVRYAWTDAPIDANLFNLEGFPALPFRTDRWKGVTEGRTFE